MTEPKGKIGIIGSGLIGRSWAMLFTSGGYEVCLFDVDKSQLEGAMDSIRQQMETHESNGTLRGKLSASSQFKLVSTTCSLKECLNEALYIQECTPELLELKQKVFKQLDAEAGPDTILASSSSAIPASKFTADLTHSNQCIISHPVNPPYLMPLVELVPAPWTGPKIVTRTRALMSDIGQSPVVLNKEIAGFAQPRIQYAMIKECIQLVKDDIISVEDIDKVMTQGLGTRYSFMGPFETAHLNADGIRNYADRYADMIEIVTGDLKKAVPLKDNKDLEDLFEQCNRITPIETLQEKRKWRDEGIAALAALRSKLNKEDESKH